MSDLYDLLTFVGREKCAVYVDRKKKVWCKCLS